MVKSAEELAMEYYDVEWAKKHIVPKVDALPMDTVLGMNRMIQISEALDAKVTGVIVNVCELCAYNNPKDCATKKVCIDGVVNTNYVSTNE